MSGNIEFITYHYCLLYPISVNPNIHSPWKRRENGSMSSQLKLMLNEQFEYIFVVPILSSASIAATLSYLHIEK